MADNATHSIAPTRALLIVLAIVRIAIPLAALAASGHKLPDLPRYRYVPLTGDATGFYAAAREFMASWARLGAPLFASLVVGAIAAAVLLWRAARGRWLASPWIVVLASLGFALLATPAVWEMHESGAAVIGWPLLWSVPMLPYRALGLPLDPDIAFGFGLPLALAANAVTVVAIAYAGFYATGRRAVGLAAAGLYAFWPLLTGLVVGSRAWENGTWTVDTGLALYTEPVSTALVTTAVALLLSPRLTSTRAAVAGVTLAFAAAVKLTNGLLAAVLLPFVWARLGRRDGHPYLVGALSFAPLIAVYWPKGYPAIPGPEDPFSLDYLSSSWTDSLLFTPLMLVVLVPLAVVGALTLRKNWAGGVLVVWALANPLVYSFYRVTWEHPRFLFASLPAVFVLWSLGVTTVFSRLQSRRGRYTLQSPSRTTR